MSVNRLGQLPAEWLAPLPYGDGALPCRILPGPLEGLTEGTLVEVFSRRKLVPCWITPFIRVSTAVPGRTRLRRRLAPFLETGLPLVVQLMGTHAERIAETAKICCELGACGIDLNCGCPSRTVVGSGSGGALLRKPHWINQCLRLVREACGGRGISVKLRTGLDSPDEMAEIIPAVSEARPDFAIVHFRTVAEQYAAVAGGYERIGRARQLAAGLPILASGDLFSVKDALAAWQASGCSGVAPARGLLKNPFLLGDIARACAGGACGSPPGRALQVLADLARTAARRGISRSGFLIEIARHALGVESPAFARLVKAQNPDEFANSANDLVQRI